MIDNITFYDVKVNDFIKLLPALHKSEEWQRGADDFYMSGEIIINETQINLFTENYSKKLNITKIFNKI